VSCQVDRLGNALSLRGHEVVCHSFSPQPAGARYGVKTLVYPGGGKVRRKLVPAMAFARQDRRGYDILHYHGDDFLSPGSPRRVRTFYGSALEEARHARSLGRILYQSLFYVFELVSVLRNGTKIGISKTTCESIPFVGQFIPCGVPLDMYCPLGNKTDTPSILFLGDLGSRKRGAMLLDIFKNQILPHHPACRLTIVGPQAVEAPQVRSLGTIDEGQLVHEYRRSWVLCMPSSYEGFGVPAIEAMACGTAPVAVDNRGSKEVVQNEVNGLLATDTSLGAVLNRVLSDSALRQRLAAGGLQTVRNEYDIVSVARRYEHVYQSLTCGSRQ